jgi:hypothetical protein
MLFCQTPFTMERRIAQKIRLLKPSQDMAMTLENHGLGKGDIGSYWTRTFLTIRHVQVATGHEPKADALMEMLSQMAQDLRPCFDAEDLDMMHDQ